MVSDWTGLLVLVARTLCSTNPSRNTVDGILVSLLLLLFLLFLLLPVFVLVFLQKGTLWGPHFCVGVIFQVFRRCNASIRRLMNLRKGIGNQELPDRGGDGVK